MHKIKLARPAERVVKKLYGADRRLYGRFIAAFNDIANDPSRGKMLYGKLKGLWSYRMGSYRIIYEIYHRRLLVVVLDLGHRKDIYT